MIHFGVVKSFDKDKGFGFIIPDTCSMTTIKKKEIFVHRSGIASAGYQVNGLPKFLQARDKVSYEIAKIHGKKVATKVSVIG